VQVYNQSDPREARRRVRRRDGGRCAACGLDTNALRRRVRGRGRARRLRALGFRPRGSLWELDHVVPLADGGGHALANLQTLCTPCHARKTASEARARGAVRRARAEDALLARVDALLERSAELARSLDPDGGDAGPDACGSSRSAARGRGRPARRDPGQDAGEDASTRAR